MRVTSEISTFFGHKTISYLLQAHCELQDERYLGPAGSQDHELSLPPLHIDMLFQVRFCLDLELMFIF